jgi:hypothetical protein
VKPKEFAVCSLAAITRITQFLDLMRLSDARVGATKIAI